MGQEPRNLIAVEPLEEAGRFSDRELEELHGAALVAGARAARNAASWGSPARPVLAPAKGFDHRTLIARALVDVPRHALEALALVWPILAIVAALSLHLGAADPIPFELRRGVLITVIALAVPAALHLWTRQRGGKAQPVVLGTLLRLGSRELSAVLVFAALAGASALIALFLAALVRAFGAAPAVESVGWLIAGAVFVQWSVLIGALAREDERSPLAVLRDTLAALPALMVVAVPLVLIGLLAASRIAGALASASSPGGLVVLGWTALLLLATMSYGSALAYALQATGGRRE